MEVKIDIIIYGLHRSLWPLSFFHRDEKLYFIWEKPDWIISEMKDSEKKIGVFPTVSNWESYLLLDYFLIEPLR